MSIPTFLCVAIASVAFANGASAGGHLATAMFDGMDHADEDRTVSRRPDALVLLSPVIDTSLAG